MEVDPPDSHVHHAPISVLLVGYIPVTRLGLRSILERSERFAVAGEADGQTSALCMAREHIPDVVLLDIQARGLNGIELLRQLRELFPNITPIVLTDSRRSNDLTEAVAAGAKGYLLMSKITVDTLVVAIQLAHSGTSALDSRLINSMLLQMKENTTSRLVTAGALSATLTHRELEVLSRLAAGKTDQEIAADLGVAVNTVNRYVRSLVEKLGAGNRTRAAIMAAEVGIIDVQTSEYRRQP